MRNWMLCLAALGLIVATSACAAGNATAPAVQPAPDRPTFLFFYTDG